MSWRISAFLALFACSLGSFAADSLYATSLRSNVEGTTFLAGNLYAVDPSTASATLVGAVHLNDTPIGILAIATHPRTGVVYGITAGLSRGVPRSLVAIDLAQARGSMVARLQVRGSDVGFSKEGILYMWAPDLHQVVKVDLETGNVTPVGSPMEGSAGGALAVRPDGSEALVAVSGAHGTLDRIDLRTGTVTRGPAMSGAPHEASIDNLTFSPSGVLYAVNSNGGAPSHAALVTINPETGKVTSIGTLPDDVRGLIFAPEARRAMSPTELRKLLLASLGVVALALIAYAAFVRAPEKT